MQTLDMYFILVYMYKSILVINAAIRHTHYLDTYTPALYTWVRQQSQLHCANSSISEPSLQTKSANQVCEPNLRTKSANQVCEPSLRTKSANKVCELVLF